MNGMPVPEYDYEPIRGLPGPLPTGETLLWQGAPSPWLLARHALRIVPITVYFVLLALWQGSDVLASSHHWLAALRTAGVTLLLGATTVGILATFAWASARATVYSITTGRVVIRHSVALSMCLNIPLSHIDGVNLRHYADADGSGELALALTSSQRLGYFVNWPHVRPLHLAYPQPALRGLPDVERAARALTQALAASGATAQAPRSTETSKSTERPAPADAGTASSSAAA
jgi:hypothetical protein